MSTEKRRSRLLPALVTGVVLVALLVVAQAFSLLPRFSNPVKEKEVDRTGPAVLKSLEDLSDLHASTGEFQTTVDIEKDVKYLPGFVSGERVVYQATGSVDGIVDLSQIDTRSVVISGTNEKVVTVVVPPPHLSKVTLDPNESKVISHDRGLTNRVSDMFATNPDNLLTLQKKATAKLEAAARDSQLLDRAEANTRATLTQIVRAAGADRVVVKFQAPNTAGT